MAIVNRNSTAVGNAAAVPRVRNNVQLNGVLQEVVGLITPATDDSATSIGRLVRVPSRARISQILVTAADFTTAGVADIGVYRVLEDGGAVVDADFFASAFDFAAGSGAGVDLATLINESTTNTLAKQEQPLWQALGLSADPGVEYDIAYTITTAFNGGQPILMKVRYVG
jgi:hypothetical protein